MRTSPSIFPAAPGPAKRIDLGLLQVLAQALETVLHAAAHRDVRAAALAELGDIELPDTAPSDEDAQYFEAIAPLYLACELEHAGLLRTAELIAGLFASGAITQPLGPTEQLVAEFWKTRRERLSAAEREQLFAQVFEPQGFYPLMKGLCEALTDQLDSPPRESDVHARVMLQEAADALAGWVAPRAVGMARFAAQDVVQALSQATHFLRDRLLQTAFGVRDMWGLLNTVGSMQAVGAGQIRQRVELGRQGAVVLGWLAGEVPQHYTFDAGSREGQQLMAAAEAWRVAWAELQKFGAEANPPSSGRAATFAR